MSSSGEKSQVKGPASTGQSWAANLWSTFVGHTSRGVRIGIASVTAFAVSSAALLTGMGLLGSNDSPTNLADRPYVSGRSDSGPIWINGQPVFVDPETDVSELLGVKDAPTDDRSADGDLEPVAPPTHAELAAQPPAALSDGSWRFFNDPDEALPVYDFVFNDDGTFFEHGAEHNHGTYVVSGSVLEMTLLRSKTFETGDFSWTEWFTMTRSGNTMTGTWVSEDWRYGPTIGLRIDGTSEPWTTTFARPQRPEDPG